MCMSVCPSCKHSFRRTSTGSRRHVTTFGTKHIQQASLAPNLQKLSWAMAFRERPAFPLTGCGLGDRTSPAASPSRDRELRGDEALSTQRTGPAACGAAERRPLGAGGANCCQPRGAEMNRSCGLGWLAEAWGYGCFLEDQRHKCLVGLEAKADKGRPAARPTGNRVCTQPSAS